MLKRVFTILSTIHALLLAVFASIAVFCLYWYKDVFDELAEKYIFSKLTDNQGVAVSILVFVLLLIYQIREYWIDVPRKNLYQYHLPYTAFLGVFFLLLLLFDWLGIIQPSTPNM